VAYVRGVVYDPPNSNCPFLAVVFGADGEVSDTRAFASAELAEAFLAQIMPEMQAKIEEQAGKKDAPRP
jgi:hypothetical protein